jgi:hypothetical protein
VPPGRPTFIAVLSRDEIRHDDGYCSRVGSRRRVLLSRMAVDESVARGLEMINVERRMA